MDFVLCFSSNYKFQCVVLTDVSYPVNCSFEFIKKIIGNDNLDKNTITKLWNEYLDCSNVDKVSKIQKELDETRIIMMDNLDQLIKRGGDLEELSKKTEEIKDQSFIMREKTKELNRCCILI